MSELTVDFITSLDGYGAAEGWPGWWGRQSPEYLSWLDEHTSEEVTALMGTNTYRQMAQFAVDFSTGSHDADEEKSVDVLTGMSKVVFSSTLQEPLEWGNCRLVSGDAIAEVAAMKEQGINMRTIGSLALCRSLLEAGLVDRFRVVLFPVITGSTGSDRIYDGYPDISLEMSDSRTFEGGLQLLEYIPTVLDGPPLGTST